MFSEKLKELRKGKGMTQQALADVLNLTKGAIAMWETGKRTPDAEMLKELAIYFNVTVDFILNHETEGLDDVNSSNSEGLSDPTNSQDDLKFALFNGSDGITDEMLDEVKQFAEMVKLREDQKKKDK